MNKRWVLLPLLLLLAFSNVFAAQTLPKWEFGLGPSLVSYPDYPGSSERNQLILPFPYFTYRSDDVVIDQREAKKALWHSGPYELDLSFSFSVPVASKDNKAREGMDDLDGSLGLGPVFRYQMYNHNLNQLKFELPVRAIIASDFKSVHDEGWVTSPGIYYYFRQNLGNRERIKITLGTSADFSTAKYNDYFYGVNDNEVSSSRSAYQATGGLNSINYIASINWHIGAFWVGAFYKIRDFSQSVAADSPLMTAKQTDTYGLVFTWNFLRSDETVNMLE